MGETVTKKLTLANIAEMAGVSKSTVSFVLNGHAQKYRIKQSTIDKVMSVVNEQQYSPSVYARALKSKKTYTIGVVIPDLVNMGFATVVKFLESKGRQQGYQLLVASSEDDTELEALAVENLMQRQVDILMVASCMQSPDFYQDINKSVPVILFDRTIENSHLPCVKTDSVTGTKQLVSKLLLNSRSEECIYFGGSPELSTSRERLEGFKLGLQEMGMPFADNYVFHGNHKAESGFRMMASVMEQRKQLPKTIFTASYSILEGVLKYLSQHNLMNENICLGTFDDYQILDCLPIKIDSIEQDYLTISSELISMMNKIFNKEKLSEPHVSVAAKTHYRY